MTPFEARVQDFLAQKTLAVAGVTRNESNAPANMIFRKLRDAGYRVYPLNPHATEVEGAICFRDVTDLPEKVDGVVICTSPAVAEKIVETCVEQHIPRVWMHRALGEGSASTKAVRMCEEAHIAVIAGGCPMMFCPPVDWGHRCMKWFLKMGGTLS